MNAVTLPCAAIPILLAILLVGLSTLTPSSPPISLRTPWNAQSSALHARIARFARVTIDDPSGRAALTADQAMALNHIVGAAKVLDALFRDAQVWDGNPGLAAGLKAAADHALATHTSTAWAWIPRLAAAAVDLNAGPWSRLDDNSPFLPPELSAPAWGIPPVPHTKPPGAEFYPKGVSRSALQAWLDSLPPGSELERDATSAYTVIRAVGSGNPPLQGQGPYGPVPYSEVYAEYLTEAAQLLRAASVLVQDSGLAQFLVDRANSFADDSYVDSDIAWLAIDVSTADFMVTIGPYEVYEDALFGYKASFSANIGIIDRGMTHTLSGLLGTLQGIEDALPIPDEYKNPAVGTSASIVATNQVFVAGDSRAGVQTTAFNLPNSPMVTAAYGTRRVILLNVLRAKFESILVPIARLVLPPSALDLVSFDAFLYHTLYHELLHGLGPHTVFPLSNPPVTVSHALAELHSPIEEAKADITGLWALVRAVNAGTTTGTNLTPQSIHTTFLVSAFRSMRFGLSEAHGAAVATQFNYLLDHGAYLYDSDSDTYTVNFETVDASVTDLASAIMTLQATGDKSAAKSLLDSYAIISTSVQSKLSTITQSVPVDIYPLDTFTSRPHPLSR